MNFINSTEDLYRMLDRFTQGVDWDCFYTERDKPAPFLKFNKSPDKCVVDFLKEHSIKKACEFGCGEGRNAIYLARHGVAVEAFDSSEVAIKNAKRIAKESGPGGRLFLWAGAGGRIPPGPPGKGPGLGTRVRRRPPAGRPEARQPEERRRSRE